MPFTSRKKFAWLCLPILSVPLLMTSCGGSNSMPNTPATPAVLTVAFGSSGALDGSSSANSNSTGNIWLAKTDGSAAMPLTRLSGGSNSSEPVWSPDGKKIAFVSSRALDGSDAIATANNIWVVNAEEPPQPLSLALPRMALSFGIWPGHPTEENWRLLRLPPLTAVTL